MTWRKSRSGVRTRVLGPGLVLRAWSEPGGRWVVEVFGEVLQGTAATRREAKVAAEAAAHRRLLDALRELRGAW